MPIVISRPGSNNVENGTIGKVVVVPITNGHLIRERKRPKRHQETGGEPPEIRRLMQCLEMLSELIRDVARTK